MFVVNTRSESKAVHESEQVQVPTTGDHSGRITEDHSSDHVTYSEDLPSRGARLP